VPIGRVDLGDDKLKGYLFSTKVDGADRETLVTWSETKPTTIDIPSADATYDYLGREVSQDGKIELTRATTFMLLPPGGSKSLKIIPPPAKAPWQDGKPSPVVLQLLGKTDFKQSAFLLDEAKTLRLVAYNFGQKPASGKLSVEGGSAKDQIEVAPGDRVETPITVTDPAKVTARLDLDNGEHALVSARAATTMPTTAPTTAP
jgi:hypothetical protein